MPSIAGRHEFACGRPLGSLQALDHEVRLDVTELSMQAIAHVVAIFGDCGRTSVWWVRSIPEELHGGYKVRTL